MNFTPELSAFQGAIISADNVHQFSRLSAKGGNEAQINYVVECIENHLTQGQYIDDSGIVPTKESKVKIFAMYIVLNSDLRILEQMVEFEEIDIVMWTIPTIPKCLMCELMWKLHMDKFIYEIIAYGYPKLSVQVASAFIDHFKYFNPFECIDQVQLITSSCYLAICRLSMCNFEISDLSSLAPTACNNFQNCLKNYIDPPNNHRLNRVSKYVLYKYLGKKVFSMFSLIDECFTNFTGKLESHSIMDFYKITYDKDCLKNDITEISVSDISNNILKETINTCNMSLLDVCKELVMEVSVDVFCCWSEIVENGKSMQQTIGELCYKIRNKLLSIQTICEHSLLSMIDLIARKPIEMNDMINATEDENILNNINKNDDESSTWIKALAYKENVCKNIELLNVIESNLHKYDEEECHKLYLLMNKHINSNLENKDYVETLCMKVFQQCSLPTKYNILDEHFNNNNFFNTKETAEFHNNMTQIFNKLIMSQDADLTDVLTVFLQNPQQVFTKIFNLATENSQQTSIMLQVIKLLEKYANYYYSNETEPCIVKITQEIIDNSLDSDVKQNNFVKFMSGLKEADIISGSKLLLLIIMTNLHKSLLNKDIYKANIPIKLLREVYKLEELLEYRAPMLAMLAQVLDMLRWKINTFTSIAPLTMDSTLELQKLLFSTYGDAIPEREKSWLKSKLINTQPLNMYYYKSLWNPPGSNYLEIVTGKKLDGNIEELTSILAQIIASCTQQEWCDIWSSINTLDDKSILKVFHDALAVIIAAEKLNRSDNSRACILYCMRNFIYITRYMYFKDNQLTNENVNASIYNVATIATLFEQDDVNELGTIVMPLFAFLSEKKNEYTLNLSESLNIFFKNTGLSNLITNMFTNGT